MVVKYFIKHTPLVRVNREHLIEAVSARSLTSASRENGLYPILETKSLTGPCSKAFKAREGFSRISTWPQLCSGQVSEDLGLVDWLSPDCSLQGSGACDWSGCGRTFWIGLNLDRKSL